MKKHSTGFRQVLRNAVDRGACVEALEGRTLLAALTIAQENALPGAPESQWDVSGAGDTTIQGFADNFSVNVGQTVGFKINDTARAAYHVDVYRMGYYQGNGARLVTTISSSQTQRVVQPSPRTNSTTGEVDCGNWSVTASWAIPSDATSGIYMADVVREDTGGKAQILFVVRNDASHSDILYQTSDTTWQAYNTWGGKSLYDYQSTNGQRAYKVSYNRPFMTRGNSAEDFVFNAEYPMVRWMESNGYDVSYSSEVDTDRFGSLIRNHDVFMSVGHDEYWSGGQRANVEAARDAGVNLAFFSGNEIFWKTRWENSIDGSNTPYKTLVCYKETQANAKIDPTSAWTGSWRDPRFSPPADGGRPENALSGQLFMVNGERNDAIKVPAAYAKLRLWRNTSIANLTGSQVATFPVGTLGYEWDVATDDAARPAGEFELSSTTVNLSGAYLLKDYGNTYGSGTAEHNISMYRAASGALVFGVGTVQWSWGLDSDHDRGNAAADVRMQQATVNVLADMGAQPATLRPGLVAATKSTDVTKPTSSMSSGSSVAVTAGRSTTVSGTATDGGGGQVAGVEVSVDGGTTWHPARGTGSWSYTWTPGASGTVQVLSRAVDDSGNLEQPGDGGGGGTGQPPTGSNIWSGAPVPAVTADPDAVATELGVKFRTDVAGTITGIRFYKGSSNTGVHTGSLWTNTGTLLATATFSNETAAGWQYVSFSSPVTIQPNTTYVASYHTDTGHYAEDAGYFSSTGVDNGPLHALRSGVDGINGVARYGASAFPNQNFGANNYWVDVYFNPTSGTDTTPPVVTAQAPAASATDVPTSSAVTATFNESIQASSLTFTLKTSSGATVAGTATYNDASKTATFTPSAALATGATYAASVSARDLAGNLMSPVTWSFTTSAASAQTIFGNAVPVTPADSDTAAIEVGVKFTADVNGTVTGLRFYKGTGNTGAHVGNLWTASGTRLATATFGTETATGWQTVTFASPVAVTAGTVYVASYFAPSGHYAADDNSFVGQGAGTGQVHALADGVSGSNGVYRYTTTSAFPSTGFRATNYWVDVLFTPSSGPVDTTPPSVSTTSPASGASGVATGSAVTATFNESVTASSIVFTVRNASGASVPGTVAYNDATRTATFTPSSALAAGTSYTASVSATDLAGNAMAAPFTWSFTTAAQQGTMTSLWNDQTTPAVAADSDSGPVELGVKFRSDVAGFITGIRFYKSTTNTGTHIGHLWTRTGTLLATATFNNESASGWQTVQFSQPVAIQANTTYVASYHTDTGHYAEDAGYFSSTGFDNGTLHALRSGVDGVNGVARYGGSAFPNQSFGPNNFWVDVTFSTSSGPADTTPPAVTAQSPAPNAAGVPTSAAVTATFSESVQAGSLAFTLRDASNGNVAGAVAYDNASRTATFTPSAALAAGATYTASVSATDVAGNAMATPFTWSFTTASSQQGTEVSIWNDTATPAVPADPDAVPIEVGVKFRSDVAGFITGIRFYKGSTNIGTHVGHLWSADGTLLATATFTSESASGWQTVRFNQPVAIQANTTYVASYHTDAGHYAVTDNGFGAGGADAGPLHALGNGVDGGNGVYAYGGAAFPTQTYQASNYWVDVLFIQ